MTTINSRISHGITIGATYSSPLTITAAGYVGGITSNSGTAASLGVQGPERYFRVFCLTRGERVAWIVRLVQIGADGNELNRAGFAGGSEP
jgi:hypothetical protein